MIDRRDVIQRLPLLAHLAAADRMAVVDAGFVQSVVRGEVLFHEGEPAPAMFGLIEGQLKLVRYTAKGKEMLLHLVRGGQTFAEAALFGDGSYPATAVALEDSTVWCLLRSRLVELVQQTPELGLALAGSVSVWTRRLVSQLELLTQRRVEERLAIYLLSRVGDRELVPGVRVPLAEPRNLIAALCGTAPEVLSRTFRRLEDEGVVEAHTGDVIIRQPQRLRELAEWIGDESPAER
jgi:CRP/FNR family transcriptional regulator